MTQRTTLYYREGSSDKVYQAAIESPVQWALWSLSCQVRSRGDSFDYGAEAQLEIVKTLVRLGARLPGDKDTVQEFRSVLLKMSWHKGLELLKELRRYGFAATAVWKQILKHAKIRDHFRLRTEALKRLFPEVWEARQT